MHLDFLLAFFDLRADTGCRQHATQPISSGADLLDERALGYEIYHQAAVHHLPLCLWVQPYVAGNHLFHKLRTNELANADTRHGRVIGNHGEIALTLSHDLVDDPLGGTDGHEPAY